jgi:hypothetical protein
LKRQLPTWTLIIGLAGRGDYGADKLAFLEAEIGDMAKAQGVKLLQSITGVSNTDVLNIFNSCTENPWRLRYLGGSQDIFFITTLDKSPQFIEIFNKLAKSKQFPPTNIGIYIQPLVQGCNCHCEINIYYDPSNTDLKQKARDVFLAASTALMDEGAFFSRPYGLWADEMYKRVSPAIVDSLQKVKLIFDPKNVLHPGVLCFKEGSE